MMSRIAITTSSVCSWVMYQLMYVSEKKFILITKNAAIMYGMLC